LGAPSKAQVEALSDRQSALLQAMMTAVGPLCSPHSNPDFYSLVDAWGDPGAELAIGPSALAADIMHLPAAHYNVIANLAARSEHGTLVRALANLVTSADGGGYASLRAYLAAVLAEVDPLWAELAQAVLGSGAFVDDDADVTTVFAPAYTVLSPTRVYTGADGALVDDTTDAVDADTADVPLFAADNDCLYLGSTQKFKGAVIGLSTLASEDVTWTPQYWNGNAWTALAGLVDGTTGLTTQGYVKWTAPSDWVRYNKDGAAGALADKAGLYWVRLQRTANVMVTPPVATCIRLVPTPTLASAAGSSHLGVQQPPLAIVEITGVDTCEVHVLDGVDYARFAEPDVQAVALSAIGVDVTITLSYVDEDGANQTQAQSAWSSIDALDTKALATVGSKGVRSVLSASFAVTTAATTGVFAICGTRARAAAAL